MQKIKAKDFKIKDIYVGSQIQGGPQHGYAIYYDTPDGKSVRLNKVCYTKKAAQAHIRQVIKITKALLAEKEKAAFQPKGEEP